MKNQRLKVSIWISQQNIKLKALDSKLNWENSRLKTQYLKFLSFEDQVQLLEFRVTVDLHLTGTEWLCGLLIN